jgi:hypothetical protein
MTPDLPTSVDLAALVEDFEHWTEDAEREPVFITRDGRQEFVLLSVDYYEQLLARASAPRSGAAD